MITKYPETWEHPTSFTAPSGHDIHIIKLLLEHGKEKKVASLLSIDELARAERFLFDRDRIRFIVARAALRQILGTSLNINPKNVVFEYGIRGKPTLAGSTFSLQFSLSHSWDMAIYALTTDRNIGIDIERIDNAHNIKKIARRFFSISEIKALAMTPDKEQTLSFTQMWVRKEAIIKAQGQGLFMPIDKFGISGGGLEELSICPFLKKNIKCFSWFTSDIAVDPNYAAAVVVTGPVDTIRGYTWSTDL